MVEAFRSCGVCRMLARITRRQMRPFGRVSRCDGAPCGVLQYIGDVRATPSAPGRCFGASPCGVAGWGRGKGSREVIGAMPSGTRTVPVGAGGDGHDAAFWRCCRVFGFRLRLEPSKSLGEVVLSTAGSPSVFAHSAWSTMPLQNQIGVEVKVKRPLREQHLLAEYE